MGQTAPIKKYDQDEESLLKDQATEPNAPAPAPPIGWRPVVKALILAGAILGCLLAVYFTPLGDAIDFDSIPRWRERLAQAGPWAPLIFVFAGGALVGAGAPRMLYGILGGAVFGFWAGSLWANLGGLFGSMGGFLVARYLGREWVHLRWGHRFEGLETRMRRQGFVIILLVRLCPISNNFLTNCLAGVSPIRWWSFLLASALGFIPTSVILVMMGAGVAGADHYKTAISLVLFVGATVATLLYFRYSRFAASVARDLMGKNGGDD